MRGKDRIKSRTRLDNAMEVGGIYWSRWGGFSVPAFPSLGKAHAAVFSPDLGAEDAARAARALRYRAHADPFAGGPLSVLSGAFAGTFLALVTVTSGLWIVVSPFVVGGLAWATAVWLIGRAAILPESLRDQVAVTAVRLDDDYLVLGTNDSVYLAALALGKAETRPWIGVDRGFEALWRERWDDLRAADSGR